MKINDASFWLSAAWNPSREADNESDDIVEYRWLIDQWNEIINL